MGKPRVHWLTALLVYVATVCVIGVYAVPFLGLPVGEIDFAVLFSVAFLFPVLLLCLRPLYVARLVLVLRTIRECIKWSRWSATSLLSMLLLAITLCSWVRTFWFADFLTIPVSATSWITLSSYAGFGIAGLHSDSGGAHVDRLTLKTGRLIRWLRDGNPPRWVWVGAFSAEGEFIPVDEDPSWNWSRGKVASRGRAIAWTSFAVPYWPAAVVFAVLPLTALIRGYIRWRRLREGRCVLCGYKLTGNVSGRCPECGCEIPSRHTDESSAPASPS